MWSLHVVLVLVVSRYSGFLLNLKDWLVGNFTLPIVCIWCIFPEALCTSLLLVPEMPPLCWRCLLASSKTQDLHLKPGFLTLAYTRIFKMSWKCSDWILYSMCSVHPSNRGLKVGNIVERSSTVFSLKTGLFISGLDWVANKRTDPKEFCFSFNFSEKIICKSPSDTCWISVLHLRISNLHIPH